MDSLNYVPYHVHTMHSNGTTNIDSITSYKDYIHQAVECGMKAIAFSEHGNLFEWYFKKLEAEKAGLKYIHAVEAYVTENNANDYIYVAKRKGSKANEKFSQVMEKNGSTYGLCADGNYVELSGTFTKELNKTKDNYHVVLLARNYEGVKEINTLMSDAWSREDNHFYYYPRIYLDDLVASSDNVLVTTACLGGILNRGTPAAKEKFINFLIRNKHRCWLEIQHHNCEEQISYNKLLYKLSTDLGIPLITGTDTHCLNEEHAKGRAVLQRAKEIFFENESNWDLTFKTAEELLEAYKIQGSLPMDVVIAAMEETNKMAAMVEEFTIDTAAKYPVIADGKSAMETFKKKIYEGAERKGLMNKPEWPAYQERINEELAVYEHNNAINFMLLEEDYKRTMREQGVFYGPSRGSVSGSIIAYLLDITDVDSIKYHLNFQRFMSSERVSLADIDTDWFGSDRKKVKDCLYEKYPNCCCEIVTFNTVAFKGAIDNVCRALYRKEKDDKVDLEIAKKIKSTFERNEDEARQMYPDVFKWVDLLNGCIISVGNHPAATVVSPFPVKDFYGTFTTKSCQYPVCVLKMKEVDKLNAVKLDILGLDNVGLIYKTCELAGIPTLTTEDTDFEIEEVWESMKNDTIGIFQWESESATNYLQELFSAETVRKIKAQDKNFSYLNLLSMGNGAIRPAGESYRQQLARGKFKTYGCKPIDEFMKPYLGYMIYQEQIMNFLNRFCGFTMGEADIVRRGFAKKTGTEEFIPKIRAGFIKTMTEQYDLPVNQSEKVINDFIRVIEDASDYLFSENHALPYSMIGYMCGYLRWKYPIEFITTAMNIFRDDPDSKNKMGRIIAYANKHNIQIKDIKFRKSKSDYFCDGDCIYKGVSGVSGVGEAAADELYALKDMEFRNFAELVIYIKDNCIATHMDMLEKLAALHYFDEFGDPNKLLKQIDLVKKMYGKKTIKLDGSSFKKWGLEPVEKYMELARPYVIKEGKKELTLNMNAFIVSIAEEVEFSPQTPEQLIAAEFDCLGYINYKNPAMKDQGFVLEVDTKYQPRLKIYAIRTGKVQDVKIKKDIYRLNTLSKGDFIHIARAEKKPRSVKNDDGKWVKSQTERDLYLTSYKKINSLKEIKV